MTLAIIVQARFGSTRLPGKILNRLGEKTVIERVLDRCAKIEGADEIVCAIPDTPDDDAIAEIVTSAGYKVSRGPEHDVLGRYARAAREVQADYVMRITSDCPFIDPEICGRVIDLMREARADYACNDMPALFPHGLDCEIFPGILLHEADRLATRTADREHVTPWLRGHAHLHTACLLGPGHGAEKLRWTLDYAEDLAFCQAVYETLGEAAATVSASELVGLCLRRPDLVAINAERHNQARLDDPQAAEILSAPTPLKIAA